MSLARCSISLFQDHTFLFIYIGHKHVKKTFYIFLLENNCDKYKINTKDIDHFLSLVTDSELECILFI